MWTLRSSWFAFVVSDHAHLWCDEATLIELIFFNSYRTIVYWSRYMVAVATAKADEMFQLTCCTYFPRFFSTFIPHRSSCIVVVRQHRWNISLLSSEKHAEYEILEFWMCNVAKRVRKNLQFWCEKCFNQLYDRCEASVYDTFPSIVQTMWLCSDT